jgi:hypothetical protein
MSRSPTLGRIAAGCAEAAVLPPQPSPHVRRRSTRGRGSNQTARLRRRAAAPLRSRCHCGSARSGQECLDTADMPTRGSPVYEDHRPRWDAACVAASRHQRDHRRQDATTEFAAISAHREPASRPHARRLFRGVAAAVADGMVWSALGTQDCRLGDSPVLLRGWSVASRRSAR